MRIAVGADHGGYPLNERIIDELRHAFGEFLELRRVVGADILAPLVDDLSCGISQSLVADVQILNRWKAQCDRNQRILKSPQILTIL